MKKTLFCTFFALTALMIVQSSSAEARHHRRSSSSFNISVGSCVGCRETRVVRQYTPVVAAPVYVAPYYAPVAYPQTTYVYPAAAYVYPQPAYVEQVYVAPPVRASGLSFSWNFFKR